MPTLTLEKICCEIIRACMSLIGNLPDPDISCEKFKRTPFEASQLSPTARSQLVNCIKKKVKASGSDTQLSESDLKDFKTVGELCGFVFNNQP